MARETERKFLISNGIWRLLPGIKSQIIRQGYLSDGPAIRVRIASKKAILTIKSSESGMTRKEFEYEIPLEDANELMELSYGIISKIRHTVLHNGVVWEIDEFLGDNVGLYVAEVELENENQEIDTDMEWLGDEVTDDIRYYNANIAKSS